jgi:glycosyltransferase involved in cell wall biosynthesis
VTPSPPSKPIRVAWIAGNDTFRQVGRILQPLAIGLMDEVIVPTIFLPDEGGRGELPNLPIDVVSYGRLQWCGFRTRSLRALADEIGQRQIDLLHALDVGTAPLGRELAAATHVPYVVSGYGLGDAKTLGPLDERCYAVLAASEPIHHELVSGRIAPANRIVLVRPGVYQVSHATYFSDQDKDLVIVAGGPLDDFAAWQAVLEAFGEVHARNYGCEFFIIGNGKAELKVRAAAEKMGLRRVVTFVDRQPATQLQGILKSADIYVSPIGKAQVDLVSLLAMAAGDPVLAARSEVDDFFIDGKTALVFTSGDAGELSRKIISILEDRQAGTALANSALAYLREHHSAAGMVAAVTKIYRSAVQLPPPQTAGAG